MKFAGLFLLLAALIASGCSKSDTIAGDPGTPSPRPKVPDATAADNAKAIGNNPNLSPEVKKVLTGSAQQGN